MVQQQSAREPGSHKIEVGDLRVPFREIVLTNGEVVRIEDTAGPEVDQKPVDR